MIFQDYQDETFGAGAENFGKTDEEVDAETDAELAELENELGDEGSFGAYGMGVYGITPQAIGDDAPVVAVATGTALRDAFLPRRISGVAQKFKWLQDLVPDMLEPDLLHEAADLAAHLCKTPGFEAWIADQGRNLAPAQEEEILMRAVSAAAFPGNIPDAPAAWLAALQQAWNAKGIAAKIAKVGGGYRDFVKSLFRDDLWPAFKSMLPVGQEQYINKLAMAYWLGRQWGNLVRGTSSYTPAVTEEIARRFADAYDQIDDLREDVEGVIRKGWVQAVSSTGGSSGGSAQLQPSGGRSWSQADEPIALSSGMELPRPQTVLAIGYGVMVAGAALKLWK